MDGERHARKIRGVDAYGRDCYVTVAVDGDHLTVHAPVTVILDRLAATRLLSVVGAGQWRLETGEWPTPEPQ